jgi:cytochrome c peroxidase
MSKIVPVLLLLLVTLFLPKLGISQDNQQIAPLTSAQALLRGPERVGNLNPVMIPADNSQTAEKILLGKKLYFDTRLSNDNTISCATCHDPQKGWSDDGPTSSGIRGQLGGRRSPPVSNSAYSPLQFWDGRAPSLEEQAKGPIANPIEMGNTHEAMLKTVDNIPGYVEEFKNVFGTSPITIDQVAQAIAAYERTIVTTDSPFDRFIRGDEASLTALEKKGLEIFNGKGRCTACHWGGNFSDGRFHNLGVMPAAGAKPDEGRYDVTKDPRDKGKFKTPTIRDVALRAPYLHNGTEKNLESLVELYNKGGGMNDANLDPIMIPLNLSKKESEALVAFMKRAMSSTNLPVANEEPFKPEDLPR